VLNLKFRSGRYLVPLMAELLGEAAQRQHGAFDVVVPVPLSPRRQRERGFNQAALLAARVAAQTQTTLADRVLTRVDRPSQRTLNAERRLANLAGAFSCEGLPPNARVLLVDDVVTTGATASACADTLAEAGARRIGVLAFARDL
jgi:ComF family protein